MQVNALWISEKAAMEATGYTVQHLRRLAKAAKIESRQGSKPEKGGWPVREYKLEAEVEQSSTHSEAKPCENTALAALAPSAPGKRRITLTDEARKTAEARLAVVQPLVDWIEAPACRESFTHLELSDGSKIDTSDKLARYLSETRQCEGRDVSRSTLWAWAKAYRSKGLMGLAPAVRADKGRSRFFARNPSAAQVVAAAWLTPFASAQSAYDTLVRECGVLGLNREELPSYTTVRSFLETIPRPIAVLAREGDRAHTERMSLYLRRGYSDVGANQIWVSDHAIHDVFVWNDVFPSVEEGACIRLQLTMIIDMRSRKPVGYSWTPNGSSGSIKTALRRAIEQYGPCDTFYCDNGKDFQKVARGSHLLSIGEDEARTLQLEIEEIERLGILTRLGITTQHCIKFHPQSKHIERFFRTLHQRFDAKFPAYTTGSAYTRTDAANVLAFEHRTLQKAGLHTQSRLLPASVFISMAAVWLEQDYSNHAHRGEGMDGLSPNQVFDAGYPLAKRRTVDPAHIEELFWERKAVRVSETAVTLNKRRYLGLTATDHDNLYLANQTQVFICYDPNDTERAVVTDLDGHRIASVQVEKLAEHSAAAGPQIAESMEIRRRHRNVAAEAIRSVRRSAQETGYTSDLQHLYDRALPASVADLVTQKPVRPDPRVDTATHLHSEEIGEAMAARLLQRRMASGTLG